MLTVVTWLWRPTRGYRSPFAPHHVNVLRRMIARHYAAPHRFVCVTDQTEGFDPEVELVPDVNDFATVPNPAVRAGSTTASCYRRLRAFHPEIGAILGDRFVSFDLDVIVTGDLAPLFDRDEDFIVWKEPNPRSFYNASLFLMTAGARPQVWTRFDPTESPRQAYAAGHVESDQGWMSYCLGPGEVTWTAADGVVSFPQDVLKKQGRLPGGARVVVFHGHVDPWSPRAQALPWVHDAWA